MSRLGLDSEFYLVERKKPAKSIEDLDEYFKTHEAKIAVEAVLTKHTGIRQDLAGSPLDRLRESAKQYKIKVVTFAWYERLAEVRSVISCTRSTFGISSRPVSGSASG